MRGRGNPALSSGVHCSDFILKESGSHWEVFNCIITFIECIQWFQTFLLDAWRKSFIEVSFYVKYLCKF